MSETRMSRAVEEIIENSPSASDANQARRLQMDLRADRPFSDLIETPNRVLAGGRYLNGTLRVDGARELCVRFGHPANVTLDVNAAFYSPKGRRVDHSSRTILTPDQARQLAAQLLAFANYAEGK